MLILKRTIRLVPVLKPGTLITIPADAIAGCAQRYRQPAWSYGCIIIRREKTAFRCIPRHRFAGRKLPSAGQPGIGQRSPTRRDADGGIRQRLLSGDHAATGDPSPGQIPADAMRCVWRTVRGNISFISNQRADK